MPATLAYRDESASGDILGNGTLEFPTECITVRELIRSRIYQDVSDYNTLRSTSSVSLVRPTDTEEQLNGPRSRNMRPVDWKAQFAVACDAFDGGRILVLVGNRQTETLDEEIRVAPATEITFLRLALLVGG